METGQRRDLSRAILGTTERRMRTALRAFAEKIFTLNTANVADFEAFTKAITEALDELSTQRMDQQQLRARILQQWR